MLKKLYCELKINVNISPVDALLIKSGQPTVSGPDASFVKTYKNGKATPFLPGSSLKGIMRSQAEKILRTISDKTYACCLPYEDKGEEKFCGNYFKGKKLKTYEIYNYSCPICKMFGSTSEKSHFSISDAYTNEDIPIENRDGVSIDRYTGGAARGAKFDMEVITKGNFKSEIHLRNFESWQIGLLGFVLKDINDGLLRLGSGTGRGFGRIKVDIEDIKIIYYSNKEIKNIQDLGMIATNDELKNYGFYTGKEGFQLENFVNNGFRYVVDVNNKQLELFKWGAEHLNLFIKKCDWYNNIKKLA